MKREAFRKRTIPLHLTLILLPELSLLIKSIPQAFATILSGIFNSKNPSFKNLKKI
jgi:hypothetical protein